MEEKELNEVWKPVVGYKGIYEVSNLGNVKVLDRFIIRERNGTYIKKGHFLKKELDNQGYYRVTLTKNNNSKHKLVSRLVAQAFIPNPNNLPCVNHKDENSLNNCVDNLEWCTQKYNCNYGTRNERIIQKKAKKINQFDLYNNYIKTWASASEVARTFGKKNGAHINRCCKGVFKQAYGYVWRYADE